MSDELATWETKRAELEGRLRALALRKAQARGQMAAYWSAWLGRLLPSPRLHKLAHRATQDFDAIDAAYFQAHDELIAHLAAWPRP